MTDPCFPLQDFQKFTTMEIFIKLLLTLLLRNLQFLKELEYKSAKIVLRTAVLLYLAPTTLKWILGLEIVFKLKCT